MFRRLRNAVLWLMNWRTRRFWFMVVVGFPVAYVLSYGVFLRSSHTRTAIRWGNETGTHCYFYWPRPGDSVFEKAFAPIGLIAEQSSHAAAWHDAYMDFWIRDFGKDNSLDNTAVVFETD